jgi:hypothetical protein
MSRGRWGGFRKGRSTYKSFWSNLRTSKAETESIDSAPEPTGFDYTTAQGIWNLNSTVQFYKGNTPPEAPTGGDTGGGGGATPVFEGYATGSSSNGSGYTLNLSSLTGGGTAAAGDLAILIIGVGGYIDNAIDQQVSSSGWTLLQGRISNNESRGASARSYYKVLGAGETSISIANATGNRTANSSSSAAVLVFSGVSTATNHFTAIRYHPDESPYLTSYSGLTTQNFIVDWGVTGGTMGSGSYSSSFYDTVGSVSSNDTADTITGFGVKKPTTSAFLGELIASGGDNCVSGQIVIS